MIFTLSNVLKSSGLLITPTSRVPEDVILSAIAQNFTLNKLISSPSIGEIT